MRKPFQFLSVIAIAATFTSCDKIAEKLLPVEAPLNFTIAVDPVIPGVQSTLATSTVNYNLETEVRKATNNQMGADFIKTVTVKDMTINLSNANSTNNLGNFESLTIHFNSAAGGSPVVLGPFAIPATTFNTLHIPVESNANIRQFFTGTNVTCTVSGIARTATTITLNASVEATLKLDK